jgi:hypothetical protein
MSERLVAVELPGSFIIGRGLPTAGELAYGYAAGYLSRSSVVSIALAKLEAGVVLTAAEDQLALLLSDELDRVDDLAEDLAFVSEPSELRARFWLFMVLSWVFEHRCDFDDPLGVVEQVYADFEYPEEIEGFVRFMPAQPGQVASVAAIEDRWVDYLSRTGREYAERVALMR